MAGERAEQRVAGTQREDAGQEIGETAGGGAVGVAQPGVPGERILQAAVTAGEGGQQAFGQLADVAQREVPKAFDLSSLIVKGAKGTDTPYRSPVTAFHLTNPIARASVTMAECASLVSGAASMAAE